jgi:hypothetical protein
VDLVESPGVTPDCTDLAKAGRAQHSTEGQGFSEPQLSKLVGHRHAKPPAFTEIKVAEGSLALLARLAPLMSPSPHTTSRLTSGQRVFLWYCNLTTALPSAHYRRLP